MNFGQAVEALKQGKKVYRCGWNGKGMFVFMVSGDTVPVKNAKADIVNHLYAGEMIGDYETVTFNPHMVIKNVDGSLSTWVPSINDCLADDWVTFE